MLDEGPTAEIASFRSRMLDRILVWTTVVSLVPTIAGIALAIQVGLWAVAVFDAVAWLCVLALSQSPGLPYRTRALGLLTLFWGTGTAILALLGPFGVGLLWLLAVPAVAGVLLGQRSFWVGEAAILVVVLAIGTAALAGWVSWADRPAPVSWWIMAAFSVVCVSLLVGLSTTAMMGRLGHSLQRVEEELRVRRQAEHDREALQQQLVVAQKMEVVGQLAGGLAHDLNNLLTVVQLEGELARSSSENAHVTQSVEHLLQAAGSAADLCRKLLVFTRDRVTRREPLELDAHLESLQPLLRSLVGERVRLSLDLRSPRRHVLADRSELEQIVTNLAANARDALASEGGTITITTRQVVGDQGERIRLDVSDDGPGIPPEVVGRVFEPFFTTRAGEGGSGLGLATVYALVTSLDGSVTVESNSAGTRFRILLPSTVAHSPTAEPPRAWATVPRGTSLLVVDDQPAIRRVIRRVFTWLGCEVQVAASVAEALELLDDLPELPDLVLTDVVMPGGTGVDLAEAMRNRAPHVPVVAMSGWTGDSELQVKLARLGVPLLRKPFTPEELVEGVAERLARRSTA